MTVEKIDSLSFEDEVLNSDKPVLVDFFASWCGPCMMMSPIIDEIADENPQIKVVKINVDEDPIIAAKYNVESIPSFVLFENAQVNNKVIGYMEKDTLLDNLNLTGIIGKE